MVIFGAGASYDSCSSSPPARDQARGEARPPLANELFLNLPAFRDHLKKYPQCRPLVPILEKAPDVEKVFGSWQAGADHLRLRQLAAIRYYLRDLIYTCERQWNDLTRGVSNYGTVLDQVRSQPKVALVTFNYDTMIERALADLRVHIDSMDGTSQTRNLSCLSSTDLSTGSNGLHSAEGCRSPMEQRYGNYRSRPRVGANTPF
jgi:hypothetical protein